MGNMPNMRRKSCQQCRAAKARCSLALPCSRCVDRKLSCHYPMLRIRDRNNLQMNILPNTSFRLSHPRDSTSGSLYRHSENTSDITSQKNFLQPAELIDWSDAGQDSGLLDPLDISFLNMDATSSNRETGVPISRQSDTSFQVETSDNLSRFVSALNSTDTSNNNIQEPFFRANDAVSTPYCSLVTREQNPRYSFPKFSTSATTLTKSLTYKVLRGQIRHYPKMMIHGENLPHFIHPRCVLRDQSRCDCISDSGAHSCLPESLAICTSLLHMYFTQSESSSTYVRGKIYEEHCRLHREVTSLYLLSTFYPDHNNWLAYGLRC